MLLSHNDPRRQSAIRSEGCFAAGLCGPGRDRRRRAASSCDGCARTNARVALAQAVGPKGRYGRRVLPSARGFSRSGRRSSACRWGLERGSALSHAHHRLRRAGPRDRRRRQGEWARDYRPALSAGDPAQPAGADRRCGAGRDTGGPGDASPDLCGLCRLRHRRGARCGARRGGGRAAARPALLCHLRRPVRLQGVGRGRARHLLSHRLSRPAVRDAGDRRARSRSASRAAAGLFRPLRAARPSGAE